jgi:NADH dehydrogenase
MATIIQTPQRVTVFGGSGFLGRHVVRALARRGYRVLVASRRPGVANHLQPLGAMGQIHPIQANLRVRWSLDRAVKDAHHVVNLVGIMHETGKQRFPAIHYLGARAVAEAAREAGASMTHVSAIGADPESGSVYARTKAAGETAVLETLPRAAVFRPSIIFGPEDQFFNRFANMARYSPVLPLIGGGETRFQPVYVGDVAEAIARSVDGNVEGGTIYEFGGPQVLTFRQCMEEMLEVTGRQRRLVTVPWWLARLKAPLLGLLPNPPLTTDQVIQLQSDTIVSARAQADGRTLQGLGIQPQAIDALLATYLWRYRPAGQFTRSTSA